MSIIPNRKIWFIFSGTLVALSLVALLVWGIKPGIDFTGGSLLEIKFSSGAPATNDALGALFTKLSIGVPAIQKIGTDTLVLRFPPLNYPEDYSHQKFLVSPYLPPLIFLLL